MLRSITSKKQTLLVRMCAKIRTQLAAFLVLSVLLLLLNLYFALRFLFWMQHAALCAKMTSICHMNHYYLYFFISFGNSLHFYLNSMFISFFLSGWGRYTNGIHCSDFWSDFWSDVIQGKISLFYFSQFSYNILSE